MALRMSRDEALIRLRCFVSFQRELRKKECHPSRFQAQEGTWNPTQQWAECNSLQIQGFAVVEKFCFVAGKQF